MALFGLFSKEKITDQLANSSSKITDSLKAIFLHKKIEAQTIDDLEELLISSDMGINASAKIIAQIKDKKFSKDITLEKLKEILSEEIYKILAKVEKPLETNPTHKPYVIIFNGVNGAGKTTTIGKIALNLTNQNKKVLIAACDTFRAAANEQLEIWAKRSGCEIVQAQKENEDPAAVAYRALDHAKKNNFDFLLIDTAGRLQNKQNLMDELKKINNVLKKLDPNAPHENLLVLDATIGQNAKNQLEVFNQIVGISGLIITKLDGSAKGGMVVSLADQFNTAIYAIGIGEKIEDLQEFNAKNFAENLVGL